MLSRGAAILLIVAAAVTPLAALLPHALERMAAVPMGVALVWLGYSLWMNTRTNTARLTPTDLRPDRCELTPALLDEAPRRCSTHQPTGTLTPGRYEIRLQGSSISAGATGSKDSRSPTRSTEPPPSPVLWLTKLPCTASSDASQASAPP